MAFRPNQEIIKRIELIEGRTFYEALRFRYTEQVMTVSAIAKLWEVSEGYVSTQIDKHGFPRRTYEDVVIAKIEAICQQPASEILNDRYVIKQQSFREICKEFGIGNRMVPKLLKRFDIEIRHGGEAVKTQWVDNPERKEQARECLRQLKQRIGSGWQGRTKDVCPVQRAKSEKLKHSTSFHRPEVKAKSYKSRMERIRQDPSIFVNARVKPTKLEQVMLNHIQELGFLPIHNQLVRTETGDTGTRWVDVFIPELNLGIECQRDSGFPLSWGRHAAITSQGIRLVYITNLAIEKRQFVQLDKYIASLKIFGSDPSSSCQDTVVWGRSKTDRTIDINSDKIAIVMSRKDEIYRLDITTASNQLIADLK